MEVATTPAALSQNINLFQSLRVLQEGENGEDASALSNREYFIDNFDFAHVDFQTNRPEITSVTLVGCHSAVLLLCERTERTDASPRNVL